MNTANNGGGSRFFGALASRVGLGVAQIDVFEEGPHEVREYRGVLGLRFRWRKPAAQARFLDSAVAPVPQATNGHVSDYSASLNSLAAQLEGPEELEEMELHAILCGKTVAVAGFSETDADLLGSALTEQECTFITLSHEDVEFKRGATKSSDLVILQAIPEWQDPDVFSTLSTLKSKRPTVVVGDRDTLNEVARGPHGGPREFIATPLKVSDAMWRAAILLVRMEANKTRRGKKTSAKPAATSDALAHDIFSHDELSFHAAENGGDALAWAKSKRAQR